MDRALEEAWGAYATLEDSIDQKAFEEALRRATGLTGEDIRTRWKVLSEEASRKQRTRR